MATGLQSVEARTATHDAARHRCHSKIRFGLASVNANTRRHAKRLARNEARRDESISKRNALAERQGDVVARTGRPERSESRPPGRPRLGTFAAVNLEILSRYFTDWDGLI